MSRSYKKTPYAGQKKCKFHKNYSNRKIRKAEKQRTKIADGGAFKKIMDPWSICDYKDITTWPEFKKHTQSYIDKYNLNISAYYWKYICRTLGMDPDNPDWGKIYQKWCRMYKRK